MDFARFDARHYPTVSVEEGYRRWAPTYESVVENAMDLSLLARLRSVPWAEVSRAIDLACGTGRIGRWLREQGVPRLDGVDLTPAMLDRARDKRIYDRLTLADMRSTGLPPASYDLAVEVLADEHLESLEPLYDEAAKLIGPAGRFVIVGYHPHFLLNGIPTHFDDADGRPLAIESHVHLFSDHVGAAHASGFQLLEMEEGVIDETWLERKPKWHKYAGRPVSYAMVWRRGDGA
jgi:SAM-dependent methyltransferase